jgi:hypothetical protein
VSFHIATEQQNVAVWAILLRHNSKMGLCELSYCGRTEKWGCVSFLIATEQLNGAVWALLSPQNSINLAVCHFLLLEYSINRAAWAFVYHSGAQMKNVIFLIFMVRRACIIVSFLLAKVQSKCYSVSFLIVSLEHKYSTFLLRAYSINIAVWFSLLSRDDLHLALWITLLALYNMHITCPVSYHRSTAYS